MKESSRLKGYSYPLNAGKAARDMGQILSVRVETSLLCNMRCKYCGWDSGKPLDDEINFDTLKRFIFEAKGLGVKSVVVIGGGEPTIYRYFKELVTYINMERLVPVIITNGLTMNNDLAAFLYENNCSVLLKCDSLKEDVQDDLSGIKGAYEKIQKGLKVLMDAGFTNVNPEDDGLRLGLSFVLTDKNVEEAPDIWRFCRLNNIYPNLELLNPVGRSSSNIQELLPDGKKLAGVLKQIKEIDKEEFQILQNNHDSHSGHCLQHLYSVYLNAQGYVQPCGAIRLRKYNFKDSSLPALLQNDYFQHARMQEKHLDEEVELTSFNI